MSLSFHSAVVGNPYHCAAQNLCLAQCSPADTKLERLNWLQSTELIAMCQPARLSYLNNSSSPIKRYALIAGRQPASFVRPLHIRAENARKMKSWNNLQTLLSRKVGNDAVTVIAL